MFGACSFARTLAAVPNAGSRARISPLRLLARLVGALIVVTPVDHDAIERYIDTARD